ncbi:MAG: ATP-binding protein, partial [Mycoplasmataceae bacterium]|nr:ATP-binding protein [Mycoplasmataceae bacterium]
MAKKMNSDFTSYNENIKNEIDKFINNENIFKLLIGINGSGKTTYLDNFEKQINKDKDKINLINVPSEIYLDDEVLKGGTQRQPSILADLLTFIQKLINQTGTFKYKIDSECESEFNKIDKLWNCIKSQNDENDMHNHKKDIINSNLIQLEKSKDLPIFDINDKTKELGNDISTGDKFYTLISLMNDILTVINDKNNKEYNSNTTNKKTILLIDEPEKFLHPTLINIVGTILCKLYYKHNISLIITTHSPILLKSIVENSRYFNTLNKNHKDEENNQEYYPKILLFKKEIQSNDQSKYNYTNNEINLFK